MTDLKLFARWKRELRRDFPTDRRVSVRLVEPAKLKDPDFNVSGNCQWMGTQFVIRIANNLNAVATLHALRHEWSHALRDHLPDMPGDSDHDEVFAAILGRVERFYIGEV